MSSSTCAELFSWGGCGAGQLGLSERRLARLERERRAHGGLCTSVAHSVELSAADGHVRSHGRHSSSHSSEVLGSLALRQAVCGSCHSVALTESGVLYVWGSSSSGQLGLGLDSSQPDRDRRRGGRVKGSHGQEARAHVSSSSSSSSSSASASASAPVGKRDRDRDGHANSSSSSRNAHCEPQTDVNGHVVCFTPRPLAPFSDVPVTQIACGGAHNLALTADGLVFAWGAAHCGQLGLAYTDLVGLPRDEEGCVFCPSPRLVDGLLPRVVVSVGCGTAHSAAVEETGRVFTWGAGACGQLGLGDAALLGTDEDGWPFQATAREVERPAGVSVVLAVLGNLHSFFVTDDGGVLACGSATGGVLGLPVFEEIDGDGHSGNLSSASGSGQQRPPGSGPGLFHSVAEGCLKGGEGTGGWWRYMSGLSLDAEGDPYVGTPVQIPHLRGIGGLSCSNGHVLAVTRSGVLLSWGANDRGQLGWVSSGVCDDSESSDEEDEDEEFGVLCVSNLELEDEDGLCFAPVPSLVTSFLSEETVTDVACADGQSLCVLEDGSLYEFGLTVPRSFHKGRGGIPGDREREGKSTDKREREEEEGNEGPPHNSKNIPSLDSKQETEKDPIEKRRSKGLQRDREAFSRPRLRFEGFHGRGVRSISSPPASGDNQAAPHFLALARRPTPLSRHVAALLPPSLSAEEVKTRLLREANSPAPTGSFTPLVAAPTGSFTDLLLVSKEGGAVWAHSFLLRARCPPLFAMVAAAAASADSARRRALHATARADCRLCGGRRSSTSASGSMAEAKSSAMGGQAQENVGGGGEEQGSVEGIRKEGEGCKDRGDGIQTLEGRHGGDDLALVVHLSGLSFSALECLVALLYTDDLLGFRERLTRSVSLGVEVFRLLSQGPGGLPSGGGASGLLGGVVGRSLSETLRRRWWIFNHMSTAAGGTGGRMRESAEGPNGQIAHVSAGWPALPNSEGGMEDEKDCGFFLMPGGRVLVLSEEDARDAVSKGVVVDIGSGRDLKSGGRKERDNCEIGFGISLGEEKAEKRDGCNVSNDEVERGASSVFLGRGQELSRYGPICSLHDMVSHCCGEKGVVFPPRESLRLPAYSESEWRHMEERGWWKSLPDALLGLLEISSSPDAESGVRAVAGAEDEGGHLPLPPSSVCSDVLVRVRLGRATAATPALSSSACATTVGHAVDFEEEGTGREQEREETEYVPCHRALLASRCDFFDARFRDEFAFCNPPHFSSSSAPPSRSPCDPLTKSSAVVVGEAGWSEEVGLSLYSRRRMVVDLKEEDGLCFRQLLSFVYGSVVPPNWDACARLLALADRLGVGELKEECEAAMVREIALRADGWKREQNGRKRDEGKRQTRTGMMQRGIQEDTRVAAAGREVSKQRERSSCMTTPCDDPSDPVDDLSCLFEAAETAVTFCCKRLRRVCVEVMTDLHLLVKAHPLFQKIDTKLKAELFEVLGDVGVSNR